MTVRRWLQAGALALALALLGAVVWVVGLVAVAQYAEDICFDDLDDRPGYRRYTSAAELWPPSHECRLSGANVEPVAVQHRAVAIARFGAVVVVPVAYLAFAAVAFAMIMRRIGGGPPDRGVAHTAVTPDP